jgi:multiple sugar transport system ATP-binding protein
VPTVIAGVERPNPSTGTPRITAISKLSRVHDAVCNAICRPEGASSIPTTGKFARNVTCLILFRWRSQISFDEPLSNLDAKLRVQMRIEIKKVHQKVRTTTVYVTHDQVEAMTLADRVVVMNHGRIEQIGTPNELYHKPATKFVASFIGSPAMNFIPCRLEDVGGKLHVRLTDRLAFPLPPARATRYQSVPRTDRLLWGIRPEHITEARPHQEPGIKPFDAVLDVTEPMGMETLVYFTLEGAQVCGRVNPNAGAQDGGPLRLAVDLNNMHLLNEVTGAVL